MDETTQNVYQFVDWNSCEAPALIQQLQAHLNYALEQGMRVGLVAVLVTEDPADPGKVYQALYSKQMPEVSLWAATVLHREILKGQGLA